MIIRFLVFLLFILNANAMDEKTKTAIANQEKEIAKMMDEAKGLIAEMKKIQQACKMLKKHLKSKDCSEFSGQIQEKVNYVNNSLHEHNHPFFAYLKGSARYAQLCGTCDQKAQETFCPLMDETLEKYNYLK